MLIGHLFQVYKCAVFFSDFSIAFLKILKFHDHDDIKTNSCVKVVWLLTSLEFLPGFSLIGSNDDIIKE